EPWQLYLTLGALAGGGVNCLAYTGQSLYLTNWFVRRRGLALSIAFSGVGIGSITILPWFGWLIDTAGWRSACVWLGVLVIVLLGPLNLLLKRRPEDIGMMPDGIAQGSPLADRSANIVDHRWAAVDWTLRRAVRTGRFWWIALAYFCGLFSWYAVQVHQTKYLIEAGFDQIFRLMHLHRVPGEQAAEISERDPPEPSRAHGAPQRPVHRGPAVIDDVGTAVGERAALCDAVRHHADVFGPPLQQ